MGIVAPVFSYIIALIVIKYFSLGSVVFVIIIGIYESFIYAKDTLFSHALTIF